MQPPILLTYRPTQAVPQYCFYIQSKGLNSGQPLLQPIPNSFIAICSDADHLQYWIALTRALFLSRKFEPYIIGSVVPFIRINDVKQVLNAHNSTSIHKLHKFTDTLNKLNATRINIKAQLKLINQLEYTIAHEHTSLL